MIVLYQDELLSNEMVDSLIITSGAPILIIIMKIVLKMVDLIMSVSVTVYQCKVFINC